MDFEDLIPIAVLIFWVVTALARRKGGKKRVPPPLPRRPQPRPSDTASRPPQRERPPGRGLLDSLREGLEGFAQELQERAQQSLAPSPKPRAPRQPVESRKKKPSPKPGDEVVLGDLASSVHAGSEWVGQPSVEELRKAIVWSEILGPPVSLRDG